MKKTRRNSSGTSYHGDIIDATLNEMRHLLGEEDYDFISGDGKVQYEWVRELDNGGIITFYDYKHYRTIMENEIIGWHIGGYTTKSTNDAKQEMERLLFEYRSFGA